MRRPTLASSLRGPVSYESRVHFFAIAAQTMRPILIDYVRARLADKRSGESVELRFSGGLQEDEIATLLGVSIITVKRDWKVARAWLMWN